MRKYLPTFFLLVVLIGGSYVFRDTLRASYHQLYARFAPCEEPLSYKIGAIDPRFNISKARLISAIQGGENIWEKGSKKDLFVYDEAHGVVTVSLIYDYRQQAVDKLVGLGFTIENNQSSYETLRAKYDSLQADYKIRKAQFEASVAALQSKQNAYNAEVQSWNARGGAPRDVYERLQSQKNDLAAERTRLQQLQNALNSEVDEINALATTLNSLAHTLNIEAANYNQIGASTGGEFEEGVYESSLGVQKINIYEFQDTSELVRVLAHELGHALGLGHVDDKNAIMYKLNQSSNDKLTVADYNELKHVCRIN